MNRTSKAWINAVFLAITLAVNTLGATGLINGLSQKQISDMYLTLITPSPATFSIWGLIYALLIISVIAMIVRKSDSYYQHAIDQLTFLFRLSCILNIVWIVAFSFVLIELSVLFILGLAVTLALICVKLRELQQGRRWLLPLTFGLYAGWLVIATVVNIAAALVKQKWNGFGIADDVWAVIILIVAVLLVVGILVKIRNAAFPLPVAWAYFGIYLFQKSPEGFKGEYPQIETAALIGMVLLIAIALFQFYKNGFALLPGSSRTKK
jgi:hypothetical protein